MKTRTFKVGVMLMAASLVLGVTSCKEKGCTDPTAVNFSASAEKDDGSCEDSDDDLDPTVEVVAGSISVNTTWTADRIYKIIGKVVVESGATLTIDPGTIVKGEQGTGTLASALVIAQGAKIHAVGTTSQPIIFTSILDNIQPGELSGTNLTEVDQGLWGGIIVLGYAPVSAADGDNLSQIEGIPTSDAFGAFGGADVADNSGRIEYVSIRHGGALIGAGNEINGLTLGGVGNGTVISNVEIVANLDDGVEFFGGSVNASNILVGFQGDDGVDIDMNYSGTVSNFMVINGTNSDEALEIDGPEGTTYTTGSFTLQDGTAYTFGGSEARGDFKSKAQGTINNVSLGEAKIRASYQNDCVDPKADALTNLTDASPKLVFSGSQMSTVTVYTASKDDAGTSDCTVFNTDQVAAEAAIISTNASGASVTPFNGWTWTSVNNKF
ncbi:MAG: hypothetical protein MK066_05520 [Crocinitomicaceae bacterium]|nr:hypothetical protein [Crocinitomicaceae bacterium]